MAALNLRVLAVLALATLGIGAGVTAFVETRAPQLLTMVNVGDELAAAAVAAKAKNQPAPQEFQLGDRGLLGRIASRFFPPVVITVAPVDLDPTNPTGGLPPADKSIWPHVWVFTKRGGPPPNCRVCMATTIGQGSLLTSAHCLKHYEIGPGTVELKMGTIILKATCTLNCKEPCTAADDIAVCKVDAPNALPGKSSEVARADLHPDKTSAAVVGFLRQRNQCHAALVAVPLVFGAASVGTGFTADNQESTVEEGDSGSPIMTAPSNPQTRRVIGIVKKATSRTVLGVSTAVNCKFLADQGASLGDLATCRP